VTTTGIGSTGQGLPAAGPATVVAEPPTVAGDEERAVVAGAPPAELPVVPEDVDVLDEHATIEPTATTSTSDGNQERGDGAMPPG
jgi:hypothetical protein